MSLSDLLNISQTSRRDKARAQDLLPVPTSSALSARVCNICYVNQSKYNCPRCNIPYCSLACFRKKVHQECSSAFSSSSLSQAKNLSGVRVESDEAGRKGIVEILARIEGQEQKVRKARQNSEGEESESDDGDDYGDSNFPAWITEEQIDGASTEELLAMLTDRERKRFLDAVKSSESAAKLMSKLERKADTRARLASLPQPQEGVLVTSQPLRRHKGQRSVVNRAWQTKPWFERPGACPSLTDMSAQQISAFVASLEKILTTQSKAPAHANLVYNLCAVLMAYTYTIRHLDISSLIGATETHIHDPSYQENLLKPAPDFTLPGFKPLRDDVDDDEPPPLEPDEPISSITSVRQTAANDDPTSSSKSRSPEHAAIAEAALDNLTRLVPFLFALPSSPPDSAPSLAGGQDPSKLLLHSLDDVSMWLLSRLSLDSELGSGGADALNLQLFQDLERLLTAEQLVPTFSIGEEVELEHRLASKLSSLPPQQAFAAAQTPLLINAVADLYSFFGRLITIAARPGSVLSEMRASVKGIKLAHRKVAFYLCSAIQAGCATSTRTSSTLRQEVQHHIQRLERRIDATAQADKLAAAISLLNKGDPLTST